MNIHYLIFLIVGLALGLVIAWLLFRRAAKSKIDGFIKQKQIVTETVDKEVDEILDKSIKELLMGREYLLDSLKEKMMSMVKPSGR